MVRVTFKHFVNHNTAHKSGLTQSAPNPNTMPMSRAHMLEASGDLQSIQARLQAHTPLNLAEESIGKKTLEYLNQPIPPMSGEKYDYLGCYDLDYNVDRKGLWNTVKHFVDHISYFFLGKRQFGRNYPDNNLAATMQSGQDAFWNLQNVTNTLLNAVSSWGSNVFHRLSSYTDSAVYLEQREYHGTFSRGLRGYSQHEWYKEQLTPMRMVNGILGILNGKASRLKSPFLRLLVGGIPKVIAIPIKLGLFIPNVLWVMTLTLIRNRFHRMGLTGVNKIKQGPVLNFLRKLIGLTPVLGKSAMERPHGKTIGLLSAQDSRTETEDMASCKWSLRLKRFITYMRITLWNKPLLALITTLYEFIKMGEPHERSGWIEGIGGQGGHADDVRAFDATECTRWRRGNLEVDEDVKYTPMPRMAKMRYRDLARYWLVNLFRVSFVTSPVLFAGLGFTPIIIKTTLPFIGAINAPIFGILVALNMFFNMGAYFAIMGSRGYTMREAARCMLKDYFRFFYSIKGTIQGFFTKIKEGFVKSPKKIIVPLKATLSQLKWEYGFGLLNLGVAAYAAAYGFLMGGTVTMLLGGVWGLFNAAMLFGGIAYINRGARQKKSRFIDWRINRNIAKKKKLKGLIKGENEGKDTYYDPQINRLKQLFATLSQEEFDNIKKQIDKMKQKTIDPNLSGLIQTAENTLLSLGAGDLSKQNLLRLYDAFHAVDVNDPTNVVEDESEAIWIIMKDKKSYLSERQIQKVKNEIRKIENRRANVDHTRYDKKIKKITNNLAKLEEKRIRKMKNPKKRLGIRRFSIRRPRIPIPVQTDQSEEGSRP